MKRICFLALCSLTLCQSNTLADVPRAGSLIPGRIIVSGFEPFGGRQKNASYQLAQLIAKTHGERDITLVEIPVIWGAPEKTLAAQKARPWTLWLAFGEGTNIFQIETVADNKRANVADNDHQTPSRLQVLRSAPKQLISPFPASVLAEALVKRGLPTRISIEAGDYLCEEMLFNLLHTQAAVAAGPAPVVLFIHTPVLGAKVKMPDGSEHLMNAELLGKFANAILPAIEESLATLDTAPTSTLLIPTGHPAPAGK